MGAPLAISAQFLCQKLRDCGADVLTALRDHSDCIDDLVGLTVLIQVAAGSLSQECCRVVLFREAAEDEDREVESVKQRVR